MLSLGCSIQDWTVGERRVVLGYADPEAYRHNAVALGALCGRVANRISGARFILDGQEWILPANDGPNHLHGGPGGLGRRNWRMTRDGARAVQMSLRSPHLDQGYPGAVDFTVTLRLEGHRLTYVMEATPDRPTPVNLAQHIYFNLAGAGTVLDHEVMLKATHHTPNGPGMIPTGAIEPVSGTRWDFTTPRRLATVPDHAEGWDGNVLLDADESGPQARVLTDDMALQLWTDQRGLQFYTARTLSAGPPALPGPPHEPFGGLCLEAQNLPNAINTPAFGDILCQPEAPYRQTTSIEIAPRNT